MSLLEKTDDARHALSGPLGRESLAYVMPLPEAGLAAFAYTWVNGADRAGRAVAVADANGPLAFEVIDDLDAGGADFDDWQIGGLTVRQQEPLSTFDLAYEGERVKLDMQFEAIHRAYAYGEHADGCPQWMASNRFEQAGTLTGTLQIDDRVVALDTTMARDHSWGARDWNHAQHWKWVHLQTGADAALHFFDVYARGARILRGFLHHEGELSPLAKLDVTSELTADLRQRVVHGTATDELGRALPFELETVALMPFPAAPGIMLYESACTASLGGAAGVGHVEHFWPQAYIDHHATVA